MAPAEFASLEAGSGSIRNVDAASLRRGQNRSQHSGNILHEINYWHGFGAANNRNGNSMGWSRSSQEFGTQVIDE